MKITIIEDDPDIIESLSLILKLRLPEANIYHCSFGEEGIELVEKVTPDLVVLDLGLPDISGYDVLKKIRSFSSIPVIILTARTEKTDREKGLELGADVYMTKPFRHSELIENMKLLTEDHSGNRSTTTGVNT